MVAKIVQILFERLNLLFELSILLLDSSVLSVKFAYFLLQGLDV